MKKFKFLIVFMCIISIYVVGCSNDTKDWEQSIKVQKRIGDKYYYEDFKEITDNKLVNKAKEIIIDVDWENAKVQMVRPPDYRFSFPNPEAEVVLYEFWVSPKKDKLELGIYSQNKYAQLDKNKSAELFEILTGEKLSEL